MLNKMKDHMNKTFQKVDKLSRELESIKLDFLELKNTISEMENSEWS